WRPYWQPALSTASSIACTVLSISTTTPRLRPVDGLTPTPLTMISPLSLTSATTQAIFVVPISRPATRSFLDNGNSGNGIRCSVFGVRCSVFGPKTQHPRPNTAPTDSQLRVLALVQRRFREIVAAYEREIQEDARSQRHH